MGLFNRKNHEEEWDILSDDEFEDSFLPENSESEEKDKAHVSHFSNKHIKKTQRSTNATADDGLSHSPHLPSNKEQKEPNLLEKDSGFIYENDNTTVQKRIHKWPFVILGIVILISSLGIIGYINTDFDENGNSYVIPLSIHYKRRYAQLSDKVLDYINDISADIEENIDSLPTNYLTVSNKLTEQYETLQKKTDTLSRYTNVPKELQNYHSTLLNFSLLTQEYLQNLVASYNDADYAAFAANGLSDFRNYLQEINLLRAQMDSSLFSNMEDDAAETKSTSDSDKSDDALSEKDEDSYFPKKSSQSQKTSEDSDDTSSVQFGGHQQED